MKAKKERERENQKEKKYTKETKRELTGEA